MYGFVPSFLLGMSKEQRKNLLEEKKLLWAFRMNQFSTILKDIRKTH